MAERLDRFFVGADLRIFPDVSPDEFDPYLTLDDTQWPLHITLFPPVQITDQNPDRTFNEIERVFAETNPFVAIPVRDARFDLGRVPVTQMRIPRLVHYALLGIMLDNDFGGAFSEQYTGSDYNAHVSLRGNPPITAPIEVHGISIFCKTTGTDGDAPRKFVYSRTVLGNGTILKPTSLDDDTDIPLL